ncbi:DinB family protein [Jeotgalibacillus aurantiacus]|uniref:DinB family protein n=1 Tax=Jeotgalibacillus aurantiacus TaxID=2763266 RepID=UPI001D0B0E52|nr:DinB family protein [Jeotgalibacillus aurantiacus]
MKKLFYYNWQKRQEWFEWAFELPEEDLLLNRTGGVGNILETLLHIVVVEIGWLKDLKGELFDDDLTGYITLEKVKHLNDQYHHEIKDYIESWTTDREDLRIDIEGETFTEGEVLNHIIVHEIHHSGQLSIWSRALGKKPVRANYIHRGLGV